LSGVRARHVRRLAVLIGTLLTALAAGCALLTAGAGAAQPGSAQTLRVGTQTLTQCASSPLAYCGSLPVPLDHKVPAGPQISIAYRWYPATAPGAGKTSRTVVPVEGGPGYPSIESVSYQSLGSNSGYSAMYGPALEHSNMLVVDNRGTGESAPLKCAALQHFSGPTGTEAFQQAASGCAEKLNHRWKYSNGDWVHASDLFTSTPAAEDMAAVIKALELPKVDLYGDSYGSFFAQVFASHFPRLVRSVVLDSTYETSGLDPWYRSTVESMPSDFEAACSRSAACAQAAPGSSWARIGELAERLRQSPISGRVPGPSGAIESVSMNVTGLVDLLSDSAEDTKIYRELDAAGRALLKAGDPAPLLRLYAQREYEDEGYFSLPVGEYSVELYVAVACLDYPQLFNMNASGQVRAEELAAGESALPASTFGPFSAAEWISQNENTEAFSVCIGWPSPTVAEPPVSAATPLFPSSLPVLVLGGELDTWTPPVDVPKVLAQVGGHSRFIELANSTHVVGEGDTDCGSSLIQRFVENPEAIDSLDASCAPAVSPIHTVGVYAAQLSEQPPLEPSPGSSASSEELQVAAAAVSTAGDAVAREQAIEAKLDHGLAGGSVKASHGGSLLTLENDQLTPGVRVSGTVTLAPDPISVDGDTVTASLTAKVAGLPAASFTATWTTAGADARAELIGIVGRQSVAGSMPAP
jgi:pimeloyl-ACP methyl ester carboxylesterase